MNLNSLGLIELNLEDKISISGGSWLSRQWNSIKQFVAEKLVELEQKYYESLTKENISEF